MQQCKVQIDEALGSTPRENPLKDCLLSGEDMGGGFCVYGMRMLRFGTKIRNSVASNLCGRRSFVYNQTACVAVSDLYVKVGKREHFLRDLRMLGRTNPACPAGRIILQLTSNRARDHDVEWFWPSSRHRMRDESANRPTPESSKS